MSEASPDMELLVARLREENCRLKTENELLREKIDLLVRRIHGASSEKLDAAQLELLLESDAAKKPAAAGGGADAPAVDGVAGASVPAKPRRSGPRSRPQLPADIEVVEVVVDPEEVTAEPAAWRQLGEEVSDRLQFEPPRYWLQRTRRRTWVKRDDADRAPLTAPLPPCLLEGSLLSPSLAAHLLVAKFADHQPFYRQEQALHIRHCNGVQNSAGKSRARAPSRTLFAASTLRRMVRLDKAGIR